MVLRQIDRWMTGILVVLLFHFVFGSLVVVLLGAADLELEARRWHWDPKYVYKAFLQGNLVQVPFSVTRVSVPAVLADGSLEPNFEWVMPHDEKDTKEENLARRAKVANFSATFRSGRWEGLWSDYRYALRGVHLETGGGRYWSWQPALGIARFDERGRLDATLGENAWVSGRGAASTFLDSLQHLPEWPVERGQRDAVVTYRTKDAFYRADLAAGRITRIAGFTGPADLLQVSHPDGTDRAFCLTSSRAYWCALGPSGGQGELEIPASIRNLGSYQAAAGTHGRIILRAEIPGSWTGDSSRHQVVVLDKDGALDREYEYEFSGPFTILSFGTMAGMRQATKEAQEVASTFSGSLAGLALPMWCWSLRLLGGSALPAEFGEISASVAALGNWPASFALLVLLAALVMIRARRKTAEPRLALFWGVVVVALGIPAFMSQYLLVRPTRIETCAACGRRQGPRHERCGKCARPVGIPDRLGIEILRPAEPRPAGNAPSYVEAR